MFKLSDIPTPDFVLVHNHKELHQLKEKDIEFPVIVKPSDEGSGRGIHQDSLVYDMASLKDKVIEELEIYNPPVMITEFIDGREFTVGIVEDGADMKVLPILEIDFQKLPKGFAKFYSFEVKSKYEAETIFKCPAAMREELRERIRRTAKKAYKALNLKDYARIDIRVKNNTPYVLEINSLPGLLKDYSDITKMAKVSGMGYDGLILNIVKSALFRHKTVCQNDGRLCDSINTNKGRKCSRTT